MTHSIFQGVKNLVTGKSEKKIRSKMTLDYETNAHCIASFSTSSKLIYMVDIYGHFSEVRLKEGESKPKLTILGNIEL